MTWRDSRRDRPDGRIFRSKCRRRNSWGKSFLKVLKGLGNVEGKGTMEGMLRLGGCLGGCLWSWCLMMAVSEISPEAICEIVI